MMYNASTSERISIDHKLIMCQSDALKNASVETFEIATNAYQQIHLRQMNLNSEAGLK